MWETTYMPAETETPLQTFVKGLLARAPQTRDWYDSRYQERTQTTGKPLYDITRGKSRNPSRKTLLILADLLEQPIEFFEKAIDGQIVEPGKASERETAKVLALSPDAGGDTVEIVSLDLSLSMGPGTLIEDFVESEPVKLDLGLVQSITRTPSDRLRLVKGVGDSMEPTLRPHDRIMVDINDRQLTRINGIYWIDYFGSHGIKRLRPAGKGRVMIISDNPAVESYEVGAEELRIEGRVIWFAREL